MEKLRYLLQYTTQTIDVRKNMEKSTDAREIVTPGMVISTDPAVNAGRGAIKTDQGIISLFVGLKEVRGRFVNVVPLRGLYNPQIGDKVIGRIVNKTPVKWLVDINSKFLATLKPQDAVARSRDSRGGPRSYGSYKPPRQDALETYTLGDIIICKILSGDRLNEPEITTLGQDLGKVTNGYIVTIPPPKIPRIIGKKGSMISLIKKHLNCKIFVAQNGRIWFKGKSAEYDRLLMDIVHKIEDEAHTTGLTDRINYYILQEKKKRNLE
jgi:exosome complex component RRP4